MVAVEPRKCDTCPCEKTNCKKIDADGIGQFCLVSQENLEKLKTVTECLIQKKKLTGF